MVIDLRSDTFTKPTPGMMDAIMHAEVGDDVFMEDPTVNRLEQKAAAMFGREAALYCPTGTMSNQIAIKCHTRPGDEVICDRSAHVYVYEAGGIAANSGAQARVLDGKFGRFNAEQVRAAINPDDVHLPRTSLVCLENTANRGGGSCYTVNDIAPIKEVCQQNGLRLHLDGARLFNAIIANDETPAQYGKLFDSISVCLNKGLGCPIGSILIGDLDFIRAARRVRKLFGGGMRQAGFMAASGIYALDNHIQRLAEDHEHTKQIAAALAQSDLAGEILPVQTNILIFEVKGQSPAALVQKFKAHNILCIPISSTQVRMVLHLDVTPEMVRHVISTIQSSVLK